MTTVVDPPALVSSLALTFEGTGAPAVYGIEFSVSPPPRDVVGALFATDVDVLGLEALFGPLVDIAWTVEIVPAVIPLPASLWLFGAAVAAVTVLCRPAMVP